MMSDRCTRRGKNHFEKFTLERKTYANAPRGNIREAEAALTQRTALVQQLRFRAIFAEIVKRDVALERTDRRVDRSSSKNGFT